MRGRRSIVVDKRNDFGKRGGRGQRQRMAGVGIQQSDWIGKLCRLCIGHGIGNDGVLATHPYQRCNVVEGTGCVDQTQKSLVGGRQIAAIHHRHLKRVGRCMGQIDWHKS